MFNFIGGENVWGVAIKVLDHSITEIAHFTIIKKFFLKKKERIRTRSK